MITSILNGLTPDQFLGYAFYLILGFVFSLLTEQIKFANPIKAAGGFMLAVWFKENWKRGLIFLIVAFLAIVFMDKWSDGEPSNFTAFLLGSTIDMLVDRVITKRKK